MILFGVVLIVALAYFAYMITAELSQIKSLLLIYLKEDRVFYVEPSDKYRKQHTGRK